MLGVKTCRAARTCCAGGALALRRCAGPGRPGGMACRGWPAGCMLGDGARDSVSFDPQHAGAPFCDVICIRSIQSNQYTLHKNLSTIPFIKSYHNVMAIKVDKTLGLSAIRSLVHIYFLQLSPFMLGTVHLYVHFCFVCWLMSNYFKKL